VVSFVDRGTAGSTELLEGSFSGESAGATNRARSVTTALTPAEPAPSRWGPFSHLAFTVLSTVALVSNISTAMFDTASGWLITSIDSRPMTASLMQGTVSLPLLLFTLPTGTLAHVLDSRRLLIAVESLNGIRYFRRFGLG
jgi:hypothetical protein